MYWLQFSWCCLSVILFWRMCCEAFGDLYVCLVLSSVLRRFKLTLFVGVKVFMSTLHRALATAWKGLTLAASFTGFPLEAEPPAIVLRACLFWLSTLFVCLFFSDFTR